MVRAGILDTATEVEVTVAEDIAEVGTAVEAGTALLDSMLRQGISLLTLMMLVHLVSAIHRFDAATSGAKGIHLNEEG